MAKEGYSTLDHTYNFDHDQCLVSRCRFYGAWQSFRIVEGDLPGTRVFKKKTKKHKKLTNLQIWRTITYSGFSRFSASHSRTIDSESLTYCIVASMVLTGDGREFWKKNSEDRKSSWSESRKVKNATKQRISRLKNLKLLYNLSVVKIHYFQ